MAKPDEERSDGLEIISIGALYEGPWEKKYWSSSRISSSDGQSNSGQTPDIAWESFERKGCSHMKLWLGKRFSGKIDGVEFFGFKNPFVQRLLWEVVANVSGTAESSLLSSDLCNGASGSMQHTQSMESCREFCTDADLLPQLGKLHFMGKRTRTNRITEMKSKSEGSIKKLRSRDWKENADSSNRKKRSLKSHNSRNSSTSSFPNEKHDSRNSSGVLPASPNLETSIEEEKKLFSAKDGPSAISFDFSEHLKEECLLPKDTEKLLNNTSQALLDYPKESLYDVNQELIAAHTVMSENLGTESYPEDEMATSTQNVNFDKNACDSVGHEIAKSMIKLSLPRALPLLKTFSRKKKAATNLSRTQLLTENLHKEQLEGKVHVRGTDLNSVLPSCAEVASTVPHCLENDLWSIPVSNQLLPLPDRTTFCQDACRPETMGLPARLDASQGSTVCRVETSERKVSEACLTFNEGPRRVDTIISNSIPGCTAPIERDMCKISEEKSVILEVHSERKETKTLPGYTEATTGTSDAILVAAEGFELSHIKSEGSFCNVPPVAQHCNDNTSETVSHGNITPANGDKELVSCQDLVELDGSCHGCRTRGQDRTMFIYKAPTKGEGTGAPSFSGYASLMMPASREIALDTSGLHFTPDGQCLVLLNNIKTPYRSKDTSVGASGVAEENVVAERGRDPLPPIGGKKGGRGQSKSRDTIVSLDERTCVLEETMGDVKDRLGYVEQNLQTLEDHVLEELESLKKAVMGQDELRTRFIKLFANLQEQLDVVKVGVEETRQETAMCKRAIAGGAVVTHSPRVDAPKPKEFGGKRDAKELEKFIWHMERYFEGASITDEKAKVRTATLYLTDTATLWWRRKHNYIEKGLCTIDTWDVFKKEIKRQFCPENVTYEARKKLRELKHKSSIHDYRCQTAFEGLKEAVTEEPVLALPDHTKVFELQTDASDFAIGGVLMQEGHPIAFESRKLNDTERSRLHSGRSSSVILKNVVKYWGLPKVIVSDRDPRFTGKFWMELFKLLGSELHFSTSFHPQTDGQTERVNALLECYLRHFVSANQTDWARLFDVAQFSYNLMRSEATNQSPFEIGIGQQPLTPLTLAGDYKGRSPLAAQVARSWNEQADVARSYLDKAGRKMKKWADKRRRTKEYNLGDMVMLKLLPQQFKSFRKVHKGLIRKYEGPFPIVAKVGKAYYRLELTPKLKIHPVFHDCCKKDIFHQVVCNSQHCAQSSDPFQFLNE
ncbi:hypothetical protein RJ639_009801 [Escallonia herrerae]|uniref:Integrase catalytic domain-containing protein n=1 Tax=Escallonia herrerae TaxID=1293975 RepID=A0AA89ASP9_9ASTE|nr:hypothetical protein RJ639_009801 [Escallonia herrerae]